MFRIYLGQKLQEAIKRFESVMKSKVKIIFNKSIHREFSESGNILQEHPLLLILLLMENLTLTNIKIILKIDK